MASYEHDDFKQVKMAFGIKQAVEPSVNQCQVNLGVCITNLKAYITTLGTYDVIIGTDWLETHQDLVDYLKNKVICLDDEGRSIKSCGIKREVSLQLISTMKLKFCLPKGYKLYVVTLVSYQKEPS